ncbi:hypothetical protein [Collimonas sp. OK607]|uniref:hypothetical protein n=1 Tax=Collimonas sp. OK607 TaxID=1798194 RepID=UPI00352B3412
MRASITENNGRENNKISQDIDDRENRLPETQHAQKPDDVSGLTEQASLWCGQRHANDPAIEANTARSKHAADNPGTQQTAKRTTTEPDPLKAKRDARRQANRAENPAPRITSADRITAKLNIAQIPKPTGHNPEPAEAHEFDTHHKGNAGKRPKQIAHEPINAHCHSTARTARKNQQKRKNRPQKQKSKQMTPTLEQAQETTDGWQTATRKPREQNTRKHTHHQKRANVDPPILSAATHESRSMDNTTTETAEAKTPTKTENQAHCPERKRRRHLDKDKQPAKQEQRKRPSNRKREEPNV